MISWAAKYQWLTSCTGLELHLLSDNQYSASLCTVSIAKDQLTIDRKQEAEGDINDIIQKLASEGVLALTLTGKGILIKKAPKIAHLNQESLNQLFPNLVLEDFYIQNFISGEYSFLALIRREIVDQLVKTVTASGHRILVLSLGPFVLSQVLNQFNSYGEEIRFDGHLVKYDKNHHWTGYQYIPGSYSDFPLKIDIEQIPERSVLAYASAFQLALYNNLDPVSIDEVSTSQALEEFRQERKFKFRFSAVLVAFLVLLFINFLLFSKYNAQNEELLSKVNQNTAGSISRKGLEKEVAEKELLLNGLGWNRGIGYAYLFDQIGQSVPSSIILEEMAVNPVNISRSRNTAGEKYDKGQISIRGKTNDLEAVNNWIYILKEKNWVKQVTLENYAPGQDNQDDQKQEFTLRIII